MRAASAVALGVCLVVSTAHAQRASESTLVARLVAYPRHGSACGRVHTVVLLQYELIRVTSGPSPASNFWVAVSCPDMIRVSFAIGSTHRLSVRSARPSRWPRPIPFPGAPSTYLWVTGILPAAP